MAHNYYYLVAGLPDFLLDEGRTVLSCTDFISEAKVLLHPEDYIVFSCLQYPFDNYNLITLHEKLERPFDPRGCFSEEELSAGLKYPDDLPEYMQEFFEAVRNNRPPAPGLTPDDILLWYFYEEMATHPRLFIREWYTFDRTLRNLVASVNCRKEIAHLDALATERDRSSAFVILGRDDSAEMMLKSNAADFGLGGLFPHTEKVLSITSGPLSELDKGLDDIRWNTLSEMTDLHYFDADVVFSFFIKLAMVERWRKLDQKAGQARLDQLIEELRSSYTAPAML